MEAPSTLRSEGQWMLGKRAGCVTKNKETPGYWAAVVNNGVRHKKYFGLIEYGSMERANRAGEEWRRNMSDDLGATKNRVRLVHDGDYHSPFYEVQLTQGAVMLIDEDDLPLVESHFWCLDDIGYAITTVKGKSMMRFHRLLFESVNPIPPHLEVDHINRRKLDNRRINLRLVTPSGNTLNMRMASNNTSGFTGVSYDTTNKSWIAQWYDAEKHRLERFAVADYGEEEAKRRAVAARKEAAKRIGNFNGLSPPVISGGSS